MCVYFLFSIISFYRCCTTLTTEEMLTRHIDQGRVAEIDVLDLRRMQVINYLILFNLQKRYFYSQLYRYYLCIRCCFSVIDLCMCMRSLFFSFLCLNICELIDMIDIIYIQDECNDWVYASKVILAELTGDESLVDIEPPTREITKSSTNDQPEWPDISSEKRKVKYWDEE